MRSKIVKRNTYRLVDNASFELPVPFRFEVMKEDIVIADYEIVDGENIMCNIATKHKEDMLTTVQRPLTISDIHFLFSCRVFQNNTPYTFNMLERVGLAKYNVLEILYKTHGVIPYDNYWIRFEGEKLTYDDVQLSFSKMMEAPIHTAPAMPQAEVKPNVDEILNQHTIDISGIVADNGNQPAPADTENMLRTAVAFSHPEEEEINNNKMSESEIEALLVKAGIASPVMSDSEIDAMFAVNDQSEELSAESASNDGGMMSDDAIAALLAANSAEPAQESIPAPVEEVPAEPSGGKMSQDDIAALFASNSAEPAQESIPAPAEEVPAEPSGGKMSQDDIAALFASNSAEPAQESVPAPVEEAPAEPDGGKMSQDDIAALFAANAAESTQESAPAPAEEAPAEPDGGKMSQDDIAALFAANSAEPAQESVPAPVEEAPAEPSGGKMSQDDIAALFAANSAEPAQESVPAPVEEAPAEPNGGKMSQDDIAALLSSMQEEASK